MCVQMAPSHTRVSTCITCTDTPCIHILLSFMMYMSASVLVLSHRVYNRAHIRVRMYATVCVHPASHLNISACARVLARINVCVPMTLSVPMQCIVSVSVAVSVCMLISNMLYCVICRCFSCVHRVFSPPLTSLPRTCPSDIASARLVFCRLLSHSISSSRLTISRLVPVS